MAAKFKIARHSDSTYDAPEPWNDWCSYAGCWTCRFCGAAAGFQLHNPSCRAMPHDDEDVECSCYGCVVRRARAGIPTPDRSAAPCDPPGACQKDSQCWTHSEWVDEAKCDPPSACATRQSCGAHGKDSR